MEKVCGSFGNDFVRNVVIFADNCKNNFLVLCEGPTSDINDSFGFSEKS